MPSGIQHPLSCIIIIIVIIVVIIIVITMATPQSQPLRCSRHCAIAHLPLTEFCELP